MTYNEYLSASIDFARDTKNWSRLDSSKYYTTSNTGWRDTCDNAHGGLDVSWAFRLRAQEVRDQCPGMYARAILDLVRTCLDNDCDSDTMYDILDDFHD